MGTQNAHFWKEIHVPNISKLLFLVKSKRAKCWSTNPSRNEKKHILVSTSYPNDSVDGRNPANQLRVVVYPIIYDGVLLHLRWRSSEFSHQQYQHLIQMISIQNGNECPLTSGQIIATSRDLTPNGGLVREIPLFQGNLGSPGPKCVPAVGPSGLNVGGVGAMVRSSIVESSWDATSHGSFVDCLAGCIIVDPLGQRYLLKSVVLHRSIGGEGILPKAFAYSLLQWTLIAFSKGIRIRIDTSTAIMGKPYLFGCNNSMVLETWLSVLLSFAPDIWRWLVKLVSSTEGVQWVCWDQLMVLFKATLD